MKYRSKLPLLLQLFSGAIGKEYVVKNSRWGKIKTKFPDMTRIIASAQQRKCRNLFREAVAYAKQVIADQEKKAAWQKRLRRRNGVYNEAVKFYMKKDKLAREREEMLTRMLIRKALQVGSGGLQPGINTESTNEEASAVVVFQRNSIRHQGFGLCIRSVCLPQQLE